MSFARTLTHESQKIPGVKFTVKRVGFGMRTDWDFKTLAFRQRLRELEADSPAQSDQERELHRQLAIAVQKGKAVPNEEKAAVYTDEILPITKELEASASVETKKVRAVLSEEYIQVTNRIQAVWIREGLISIEQKVDGEPVEGGLDGMTADELLDFGPQDLAREVYEALEDDGKLTGKAIPNLSPPITSGEAVGGAMKSITAENAGVQPVVGT